MAVSRFQIARLRILATSDVHMHLLPHDYFSDVPTPGRGLLALTATMTKLRRQAAAEAPPRHVLLVDNGDTLQGNALGDHLALRAPRQGPHPVAQVMNALGYDAMGLGNHDLDYGLDYLEWFARSLDAPLLSSNTTLVPARDWLRPHTLCRAGGITVGILSILPPGTVQALHAHMGDAARAGDALRAVRDTARQLRRIGADVVLALAHAGLDPGDGDPSLAGIARAGVVDALVGGHEHGVFPGPVPPGIEADVETGTLHGVPTAMPGCDGALLGCIDLDLDRTSAGAWSVTRSSARVLAPPDSAAGVQRAFDPIRPLHAETSAMLDRVIARTPVPLNSYFAQVRPTRIHALIAEAQRAVIEDARQGTRLAGLPILSAVSLPRAGGTGGARNYTDIPAGPLTARHVAELSIYANLVWAVEFTGAELAEWLEKSAATFAHICAAHPGGLHDPDVPAFDFDVICGLTCVIDPTQPARYDRAGHVRQPESRRVHGLAHDGAPIPPGSRFLVAVNSFRACGGGHFPGLHPDRPILRPDRTLADALHAVLTRYTTDGYGLDTLDDCHTWRFADTCAGTATWFETGPGALDHLDEIAHLSPGTPEPQPSGFVRIPITL